MSGDETSVHRPSHPSFLIKRSQHTGSTNSIAFRKAKTGSLRPPLVEIYDTLPKFLQLNMKSFGNHILYPALSLVGNIP